MKKHTVTFEACNLTEIFSLHVRNLLGRRETVYFSTFIRFWVTNLGKINRLYAPVDNTHQAKNGPKKEKKVCTIHSDIQYFADWLFLRWMSFVIIVAIATSERILFLNIYSDTFCVFFLAKSTKCDISFLFYLVIKSAWGYRTSTSS